MARATIFSCLILCSVIGTLVLLVFTWTHPATRLSDRLISLLSNLNPDPNPNPRPYPNPDPNPLFRQTINGIHDGRRPFSKESPKHNCTEAFRKSHFIRLEFQPGNTGNALIQIFALLATSYAFCYTPVICPRDRPFKNGIEDVFDIKNVKLEDMDTRSFEPLTEVLTKRSQDKLSSGKYNFSLEDRSIDYHIFQSQEDFIRSSITFKRHIDEEISEYMDEYFGNKSTVAIHVRRTDRVGYGEDSYVYKNLEWYKEYINAAMGYLRSKHTNLAFVFLSDDPKWCRARFRGPDVYFSPFRLPGNDLALISRCDHVILTVGTFGWCGAMLGQPESVLYSRKYAMPWFTVLQFFLPSWIEVP